MRQFKPIPPSMTLAPTLARRVFQLREFRNLTVLDLAKLSRFPLQRIEDIESGLETWLSTADRQLLAKALSVEPQLLLEVEARHNLKGAHPGAISEQIVQAILHGARDLDCPDCGAILKCSIQAAFDIEGNPTQFAKAYCLKCPFILR